MESNPNLLTGLAEIGGAYLQQNLRVTVESNLLPPLTIYRGKGGTGGGGGLGKLLGVRAGVVVRDAKGNKMASFGNAAEFEPLRAALLVAGLLVLGGLALRFLRR